MQLRIRTADEMGLALRAARKDENFERLQRQAATRTSAASSNAAELDTE
jgi:hypothetical protein